MAISVNQLIPGYVDQAHYSITATLQKACATVETKNNVAGRILSFPVELLCTASDILRQPVAIIETVALAALNGLGVACKREGCKANLMICAKKLPADLMSFGVGYSFIHFRILRIVLTAFVLSSAFDKNHKESATRAETDFIKISCQRKHPTIYERMERDIDLLSLPRQNEIYRQLLTTSEEELPSFVATVHQEAETDRQRIRQERCLLQIRRDIPVYQGAAEAQHRREEIAPLVTEIERLSPPRRLQRYIELITLPRSSLDQFRQSIQNEVAAL